MKRKLLDADRNEYQFFLTENEVIGRICECLKQTNPNIRECDIRRNTNSKEYNAEFVDEFGFEVKVSVGIGNLKRYFGSRLIELLDNGGMSVRRVIAKKPKKPH